MQRCRWKKLVRPNAWRMRRNPARRRSSQPSRFARSSLWHAKGLLTAVDRSVNGVTVNWRTKLSGGALSSRSRRGTPDLLSISATHSRDTSRTATVGHQVHAQRHRMDLRATPPAHCRGERGDRPPGRRDPHGSSSHGAGCGLRGAEGELGVPHHAHTTPTRRASVTSPTGVATSDDAGRRRGSR